MRSAASIAACVLLLAEPAMAQTRLTDQSVRGWRRICSYEDLRPLPLTARRARLERIFRNPGSPILRISEAVPGDGRELYYLAIGADAAANMMAVPVDGSGSGFRFGEPRRLFTVPVWMGPPTPRNHFDVTKDGERFLIDVVVESSRPRPLTIMSEWEALVGAR